jgi:hypothetical protein
MTTGIFQAMNILDNEVSEDEAASKDVPSQEHDHMKPTLSSSRKRSDTAGYWSRLLPVTSSCDGSGSSGSRRSESSVGLRQVSSVPPFLRSSVQTPSQPSPLPGTPGGVHPIIHHPPQQQYLHRFVHTQTHTQARALRVLFESLDGLKRSLTQLVERAQRLVDVDNIRPRIAKLAAGLERLAEL